MLVRRIRTRSVEVPLPCVIHTARGTILKEPLVLIDLLTDGTVIGKAYVRCHTPLAVPALVELIAALGRAIRHRALDDPGMEPALHRPFALLGTRGLVGMAIAGLDMALWDARAKAADTPLLHLLGGSPVATPVYALVGARDPLEAARQAMRYIGSGFAAIKIKLGHADLAADLDMVRAVRRAIGKAVPLMVDYNQSLSRDAAGDRARVLEDEGVYWIEEPLAADDLQGYAHLAAATRVPIQLGENWTSRSEMELALTMNACDRATFDVSRIGGVSGWLDAAETASRAQLPVSSHGYQEISEQLMCVTPTRDWVEYREHAAPILKDRLTIEDGVLSPPDIPGVGIEWDEEAVERFST